MKIQIGDGTTWTDLTPVDGSIAPIAGTLETFPARANGEAVDKAVFFCTTASAAQNIIQAVQRWLDQAAERRSGKFYIPKVFVRVSGDYDAAAWFVGEVGGGQVDGEFSRERFLASQGRFEATWSRLTDWRAESVTALATAVSVRGTYDGSGTNIADLGQCDAPVYSPVRVAYTNASGVALSRIYAGLYRARASFTLANLGAAITHEAETGTVLGGTGTSTALGGTSNGNYRAFSWSGTANTPLLSWSLSQSQLAVLGAREFKPFVRVIGAPTNLQRMSVSLKHGTLLLSGGEYVGISGAGLLELPSITFPPYLRDGATAYKALTLELGGQGAGSVSVGVDCMHLMPTGAGCFRRYVCGGVSTIPNGAILLDAPHTPFVGLNDTGLVGNVAADGDALAHGSNDFAALVTLAVKSDDTAVASAASLTITAELQKQRRAWL